MYRPTSSYKKAVYCVETGKVYNSLADAARDTGSHATNICRRSVKSLCTVASANAGPVQKILPESAMRRRDGLVRHRVHTDLQISLSHIIIQKSSAQIDVRSTAFAAYLAQGP
eukprot:g45048.t1